MFETVLLATDFSASSDAVVTLAGQLRKLGTHKVILAHALGVENLDYLVDTVRSLYEPKIQDQKATLEGFGYQVSVVVAPGRPELEISRLAAEKAVSLILAGSHGASLSKQVLLSAAGLGLVMGNVAFGIVSRATVPVLILPVRAVQGKVRSTVREDGLFDRILYPTDFSDTAERAFATVAEIVGSTAVSRATLLHVQDKERVTSHLRDRLEEFNRIDQERLGRLAGRLKEQGHTDVKTEIIYGSPIQEILKMSKEGFTLIIMGSQGRGYISEIFLGSVSHNVVRHSTCPVLLVPAVR
jgi:nucleotide-binding universal stress UspA family protein